MPKRDVYESDDGFVEDAPKTKKHKGGRSTEQLMDEEGNAYWEISNNRRIQVSDFKGKAMVNIREYYEKDGKMLPGKKGISLPMDQYIALLTLLPQIETALRDKGIDVPRPIFDQDPVEKRNDLADRSDEDEAPKMVKKSKKKNHEPTDDEDED